MWREPDAQVILGIETSCDETAAALVDATARSARTSSPPRPSCTRAYGGVVPEIASRRHLELVIAGARARRSTEAGAALDDVELGRRHRRARADRRAARRRLRREGARLGARAAARPRQPPARARRLALPAAARPRAALHLPARERRPHAAARRARARWGEVARARDDARRRGRRGVRQGRPPARPALPGRRRDRPPRPRGRPRGLRASRSRASPASTSRSPGSRPRSSTPSATSRPASSSARRADLAASYQHAIVRALVERVEAAGAERIAIVGGVAANSRAPRRAAGGRRGAARALHRQRRDDRLGRRATRRRSRRAEYLALDAFASGGLSCVLAALAAIAPPLRPDRPRLAADGAPAAASTPPTWRGLVGDAHPRRRRSAPR